MRTNFALLATFVILTISFANGGKTKEREYALLRKEAKVCKVGNPIKLGLDCKTCTCVSKGVIECSIEPGCEQSSSTSQESEPEAPSAKLSKQQYEKLREEAGHCKAGEPVKSQDCNTCYCVAEGVVECTRVLCSKSSRPLETSEKETSNSNQFGKLRETATLCKPDNEPLVIGCRVCVCLIPGVMSCHKTSCDKSLDTSESDYGPEIVGRK